MNTLFHKLIFLKIRVILVLIIGIFAITTTWAQCGFQATCPNTNYLNFGMGSNSDAASIEYDNFISAYHTTIVRTSQGTFQVWGEYIAANGVDDLLSPTEINSTNFPALTGTILKAHLGSNGSNDLQGIVLTTTGLFAWGQEGRVVDNVLTSSTVFQKITVDNNTQGLPIGIVPSDVKMLFVTERTIALTTCSGEVFVLSLRSANRGVGSATSTSTQWYQVTTSSSGNPPLSNVVSVRGSENTLFALTASGQLYTWGSETYLGNNSAMTSRSRATLMTLPTASPIKMIGATRQDDLEKASYYVLNTNGSLYCLGANSERQLGDWSTTERLSWIQPRYTDVTGPVMTNIHWISPNEHDSEYAAINVLTKDSTNFNWGDNNGFLLGREGSEGAKNPGLPNGISLTDKILAVETGGHTSMLIKKCEDFFGYVGHRIRGSMGDGSDLDTDETTYTFATALVYICGATNVDVSISGTPVLNTTGNYCNGTTINIEAAPSGGTYSLTGEATLSGNNLTFTGIDDNLVTLEYTYNLPGCLNPISATLPLSAQNCVFAEAGPATASICAGSTYTTEGTSNSGTITWSTSSTGTFINGNTNTATYTPSATDILAGTVTLTETVIAGVNTYTDQLILSITDPAVTGTNNGNQSICVGSTATLVAYNSSAIDMDGTNDYIALPAAPYFDDNTYTIEGWVFVKGHNNWQRLIDFGNGEGQQTVIFALSEGNSGAPTFEYYNTLGLSNTLTSSSTVPLNQWVHLAAVRNGSEATIYMNGLQVATTNTWNVNTDNVSRSNCYVGRSNWAGDAYANAKFGEFRIWSTARTQTEVQNNMYINAAAQAGLRAAYRFDQGLANQNNTGITTIDDHSGANYVSGAPANATLFNAALTGSTSNWTNGRLTTPNGTWSSATPAVATINATTGVVTGVSEGSSLMTYTVTGTGACPNATSTATVSVDFLPSAPSAASTLVICPGATVADLTATVGSGQTLQWYTTATGGTPLASSTALVSGTTYFAQAVSTNGCVSTRTAVTVRTNNSLNFDGINDRVNLTSNSIQDGATAFTIEAWIKPNNSNWDNNYHAIFGTQTGGSRNPSFYLLQGKIHVDSYEDVTLTRYDFLTSQALILQNVWSHIALVKEGNQYKVYINGNLAYTGTAPNAINIVGPYQLGYVDNYFAGLIDEVRFWNIARSQTQIQAAMSNELAGNESGLVDYYNFNQGVPNGNNIAITTLNDNTSPTNNGAITNFARTGTSSNFALGFLPQITGNTSVSAGSTLQLSHTNLGGTWSSSNNAIATINSSGVVTGVGAGSVTITYTFCGQSTTYTVTVFAQSLSVNSTGITSFASCQGTASAAQTFTVSGSSLTSNVVISAPTGYQVSLSSATGYASSVTISASGTLAATIVYLRIASTTAAASVSGIVSIVSTGATTQTISLTGIVTAAPSAGTLSGPQEICVGSATTYTTNISSALDFDGFNDFASAPAGVYFDDNTYTVEGWVFVKGISNWHRLFDFGIAQDNSNVIIGLSDGNTGRPIFADASQGGQMSVLTGPNPLPLNQWVHIAAVRNGVNAALYVNGVSVASVNNWTIATANVTRTNCYIGRSNWNNIPGHANAKIGELRIWSSARTAAQIQANMNTQVSAQTDLRLLYRFDQGIANQTNTGISTLVDHSGANHVGGAPANATLSNFALTGSTSNWTHGPYATQNGTWSSATTAVATVNSTTGVVTGVSIGTSVITYTVAGIGGCANSTATTTVTVTAPPSAGTLSGTTAICSNGSSTLSSSLLGGTWTSAAPAVATINSITGVVTGVSAGTSLMTYTVTGTGGCANSTATTTVTVTAPPSAGNISGTTAICSNGSSILTSSVTGGSWTSATPAVATIDSSTGAVAGISAGTSAMTYTIAGTGGCANATATATVSVTAPPSAGTLSGTTAICANGSSTLTSSVTGGSWSSATPAVATINASTGVVAGVSAGTSIMTYTVTATGGCANASTTATLSVTAASSAVSISGTTAICANGSSTLSSSVTGGSWSSTSPAVATINASTGVVAGMSAGLSVMTYTVTGTGGCANVSTTATVTVTAVPSAGTISGTTAICANGSSTLSSSVTGGSWSSATPAVATISATSGAVAGLSAGTSLVTYTITATGGCANVSTTATVTVTALPSAGSISGTTAICSAGSSTLSSTIAGGSWSSATTSVATINAATGAVAGVSAGTSVMTYTVFGAVGCADATATAIVTVTAPPSAGNISGTTAICSAGSSTLSSTIAGGSWSSATTSVATINASSGAVAGVGAGTSVMTYTVTGTGGCANATATATFIVTAPPSAGPISGTTAICSNGTSTLTSSVAGGSWSSATPSVATVNASSGTVTGVSAGTAVMTYTLTGNGGCANATTTAIVTVTALPSAGNISGTTAICSNGSSTLTSSATGGIWSSANTSVATINASTGAVAGLGTGISVMSYTVTGNGGCINATVTQIVTVTALPTTPTAISIQPTCATSTGTINMAIQSEVQYGLNGSTYQDLNIFYGLSVGTYLISVRSIANNACITSGSTIIIAPSLGSPSDPNAVITAQPTCATPTGTLVVNAPIGAFQYALNGVFYQTSTTFTGLAPGTYNLTARRIADNSCISTIVSYAIAQIPAVPAVPSAFALQPTCAISTGTINFNNQTAVQYALNGSNYQSAVSFANLAPGNYTLSVRNINDNSCVTEGASVTITASDGIPSAPTATASTQPTCASPVGAIAISAPLGPFEYSIDGVNYQASTTFNSLNPGTYNIRTRRTTDNTCISNITIVTINAIPATPILPTAIALQPTCAVPSGTIVYNTQPGVQYSLNGFSYQAATTFTGVNPGSYFLYARNVNDATCVSIGSPVVINAISIAPATPVIGSLNQPVCGTNTGSFAISNPIGNFNYSINGTTYQASTSFTGLIPGTYNCTARSNTDFSCISQATQVVINAVPNCLPVANNDVASTNEDTPVTVNVTTNDTDIDGTIAVNTVDLDPTTPGIQTTFTNTQGTWTVVAGVVTYTPETNFNGIAFIGYTVNDNGGATSNVATITINIAPVNDAPILDNEFLTVNYNTSQSGDLTNAGDFDPDGTALVVNTTPLVAPQNGTVTIAQDGTFTYVPSLNFVGTDIVVVEVCDQGSPLPYLCGTDTIFITVSPCSLQDIAQDCDFDGLSNGEEASLGTDAFDPDTDGDGVIDGTEVVEGTNPLNPCSLTFASQTVTPTNVWNNLDCDNDGLTNGQEVTIGTDPTNPDTDGDGVLDGTEAANGTLPLDPCSFVYANQTVTPSSAWADLDCDNDGLTNGQEVTSGSDPTSPDTDGDGVLDGTEVANGTNPNDPCSFVFGSQIVSPSIAWNNLDCDNDGLLNGAELAAGTDPTNPDTDGDGVIDGTEVANVTLPLDPCSLVFANQSVAPSIAWSNLDCDNDGLLNGVEVTIGTDPTNPDTDGDGVSDGIEVQDQTNPIDPCQYIFTNQTATPSAEWAAFDCDGDGLTNGEETSNGSDPTDPCDPLTNGSNCNVNIVVPEAFSPDGDGTNDTFIIEGIEYFDENEIIIFNRWGTEVFRMNPYNNTWDGKSQNVLNVGGDELPTGTYFYILDTKTDKYGVIKGYIYLKR